MKKKSLKQIAAEWTDRRLGALFFVAGVAGDVKLRDDALRALAGSARARRRIARLERDGWLDGGEDEGEEVAQ